MGARYYASGMGRWITEDPLPKWLALGGTLDTIYPGGKVLTRVKDVKDTFGFIGVQFYDQELRRAVFQRPLVSDLHRYFYAYNNPLIFVDPDGMKNRYKTISINEQDDSWIIWSKTKSYKFFENALCWVPFGKTFLYLNHAAEPGETTWKDVGVIFVIDAATLAGNVAIKVTGLDNLLVIKDLDYAEKLVSLITGIVDSLSDKEKDAIGLRMIQYLWSARGEHSLSKFDGQLGEFDNYREELRLYGVTEDELRQTFICVDAFLSERKVLDSVIIEAFEYALETL